MAVGIAAEAADNTGAAAVADNTVVDILVEAAEPAAVVEVQPAVAASLPGELLA